MGLPAILYLDHFNHRGGAQEYILELAAAIQRLGCRAYVSRIPKTNISLSALAPDVPQIPFRLLGTRYQNPLFVARILPNILQIRKFAKINGITHLHCNSIPALIVAFLCRLHMPIIFTCHDYHLLSRFRLGIINRTADQIICVSSAIRDFLLRQDIKPPMVVIPNGLTDYAQGDYSEAGKKKTERVTFGMVGRIEPWKGCDLFIKAAKRLYKDYGDKVAFALVGLTESPRYFQSLQEQSRRLPLEFRPFTPDKRQIYRRIDVVVNCSLELEPFGRTLVEGGIFSLPVIGPDQGGPAEIIVDGETGLLFKTGDVDSLFQAMDKMMDSERRLEIGRKGRQKFLSEFVIDTIARRVADQCYCAAI
jgi:glycosyltransferase involved in cell wall biosynthesis